MSDRTKGQRSKENWLFKLSFFFVIVGILLFAITGQVKAATQWVSDPGTCNITDPTNFPGQNCAPNRMCGDSTGIAQCYNTATLLPPAVSATSNTLYSASYPNGGYLTNCYAAIDGAAPYCDNNQAFWCNRSTTCYTTQARDTVCTANTWNTSTCGSCRTGFGDCNLDGGVCEIQYGTTNYPTGANNNYLNCTTAQCDAGYLDCDAGGIDVGNGCEVQNGATCTLGGLTGTWSGCTCVVAKQYFETGTEAQYATTDPLLWGVQFGVGDLIHFGNSTDTDLFVVENDGSVNLAQITAPGVTTDKLYNVAGSLYWNGVMIGAGGAGGGSAIWDTDLDTGIQTEETADDDIIRFDIAGHEAMVMQETTDEPLVGMNSLLGSYAKFFTNRYGEYDRIDMKVADVLDQYGGDFNVNFNPEEGFQAFYDSNVSSLLLSNNSFQVAVNNHAHALTVNPDGNVGIGTNSPSTLLNVQGGLNGAAVLTLDSDDGNANGADAGVIINSDYSSGSDAAYVSFQNNGTQSAKFYGSPIGSGFIVDGNNSFDITTDGSTRLFVSGDGRVGVNTATPLAPLNVASTSGRNTMFSMADTIGGGLYIGNGSYYSGNEAGLYDLSDNPLMVFDFDTDLIHFGNSITTNLYSAKAAIGTSIVNDSAMLSVDGTTGGFLMPRLTTVERDAIVTPSTALQIYNTTTGQFEYYNGSDWVALGGGGSGSVITSIDLSLATYNGDFSSGGFSGYEAANDICNTDYAGSHFCRTDEIIQYIQLYGATGLAGTSWIAEGPPGFTSNSNDCNGWTDSLDTKLGAFWEFSADGGGMGWLTTCAVTKQLACCQ